MKALLITNRRKKLQCLFGLVVCLHSTSDYQVSGCNDRREAQFQGIFVLLEKVATNSGSLAWLMTNIGMQIFAAYGNNSALK